MTHAGPGPEDLTWAVGRWRLDAPATVIVLRSRYLWGLARITARLRAVDGHGQLSAEDVRRADSPLSGRMVVAAGSVSSGLDPRDRRLRGPEFLDAETYPTVLWEAERVRTGRRGGLVLQGRLTIRDLARPLTVPVTVARPGTERMVLSGRVEVDRRTWGLSSEQLGASPCDRISIEAPFDRVG